MVFVLSLPGVQVSVIQPASGLGLVALAIYSHFFQVRFASHTQWFVFRRTIDFATPNIKFHFHHLSKSFLHQSIPKNVLFNIENTNTARGTQLLVIWASKWLQQLAVISLGTLNVNCYVSCKAVFTGSKYFPKGVYVVVNTKSPVASAGEFKLADVSVSSP